MNLTQVDPRTLLSASRPNLDPSLKKARDLQTLRAHTQEFEAIYVNEMFKAMRKSIPEGGLFEKDSATEFYQELADMELSRAVSKGDGLGLGKAMFEQLRHLVENKLDR